MTNEKEYNNLIFVRNFSLFFSIQLLLLFQVYSQSETKCRVFTDYCDIIQNIEEQCGGVFVADIYVEVFEDNVLNNFDKYTQIVL